MEEGATAALQQKLALTVRIPFASFQTVNLQSWSLYLPGSFSSLKDELTEDEGDEPEFVKLFKKRQERLKRTGQ